MWGFLFLGWWVDLSMGFSLGKKITLLLIISVLIGDTLILKDKSVYSGKMVKYGNEEIIIKAFPSANMLIDISEIKDLTLSNGTKILENGEILVFELKSVNNSKFEQIASFTIGTVLIIGIMVYFFASIISFDSQTGDCGIPCGGNADVDYP